MGWMTRVQFLARVRKGFFSLPPHPDHLWTLPSLLSNGYQEVFPWRVGGVKQLAYEADHSPPSSAKVMNVWSYTPTLPCIFLAWCLIKHRDTS